ncbi:MAG: hypothetical protein J6X33_03140 [Clostridiales bacterium]|nr:hypothetical protein [Clostridiales bacterium]
MATLTRLASTLTAKYYPSPSLTDAFYMDGRLCGKREIRQADITTDKDERGFLFSIFTHPAIKGFEPGTLPPYEPQLRDLCNNVKFGLKDIDSLIEKFMTCAVDITGMMKLSDGESRTPYFSGVIVKDAEAFAVTIGNGLAFLYRDDTLFPLTDAGIPMEPIDAYGNRVGDFQYYCSSKTANALWSNFFTVAPDDCIILCNKAIYDALGQREILRILTDAEDQCDAAGTVITQASARMPNTPMQFSISFVENVTTDEKKGLFGFRKKNKEEDMTDMSIKSTFEGGEVGKAIEKAQAAGFATFATAAAATPPASNQQASADNGIVVPDKVEQASGDLKFPEGTKPAEEVSAEEMMKTLFGQMNESSKEDKAATAAAAAAASSVTEIPLEGSPFVVSSETSAPVVPEEKPITEEPEVMETISETKFVLDADEEPTKPVASLDGSIFVQAAASGAASEAGAAAAADTASAAGFGAASGVLAEALKRAGVDSVVISDESGNTIPQDAKDISSDTADAGSATDEIVFTADSDKKAEDIVKSANEPFDPYSVGSSEEMQNTPPPVFGDDGMNAGVPDEPLSVDEVNEIPVPDFVISSDKPELNKEETLNVDFPETAAPAAAAVAGAAAAGAAGAAEAATEDIILPFANGVETYTDTAASSPDVPQMPLYGSNAYDTPVNAVNSEQPMGAPVEAIGYGDYDNSTLPVEDIPSQAYGGEVFSAEDQNAYTSFEPQAGTAQAGYAEAYGQQYAQQYTQQYAQPEQQYGYAQPQQPQAAPDMGYGAQQQTYSPYDASAGTTRASSSSTSQDDWIMDLLGGDDDNYASSANAAPDLSSQYTNPGYSQYRPAGSDTGYDSGAASRQAGPSASQRRPQGAGAGSGNGNGGKRKVKLNRNGYIFLIFVALIIIGLIIIISLIAKSCSKDDKPVASSTTTTSSPLVTETTPAETTTQTKDPSAPIGRFTFSDYTGFRSWWDLFNTVYNYQLENESDPMIKKLIEYNNLDPEVYKTPHTDDSLLLPPKEVLEGTIPNTFSAGGAQSPDTTTTTTTGSVDGQISMIDGDNSETTTTTTQAAQ